MELRPGYKLSAAGVIPENWKAEAVGEAFEIRNQLRLPLSQAVRERMSGPYPYFGPTSAQGWINEYRIEGEHALIGEDGDHFLKWRTHPMTLFVNGKFNVNNHAHVVKGTKNLTAWFYWYFVNRDICDCLTRQGASRYKLTKAALQQLPCAIPPREEQGAITTVLSDIEALLSGLDHLIAKKCNLKHAAMQQLLTGRTRLPGFQGEWEVTRLGDMLTICHGRNQRDVEDSSGLYPILATGGQIGTASKALYYKPSVLIGRKGTINQPRYMDTPFWTVDTLFYSAMKGDHNAKFLYYRFCLIDWMQYNEASGVPSLNAKAIENVEVAAPSPAEQSAIAAVLSDMDAELIALEARRDKTRALKQGMMQELLTGRTRLV